MQAQIVKVQSKGLITLPKSMRDSLGINEMVKIVKEKTRLILEPVSVLPYSVRHYSKKDIEEFLSLDEKETKELKNDGLI